MLSNFLDFFCYKLHDGILYIDIIVNNFKKVLYKVIERNYSFVLIDKRRGQKNLNYRVLF